MSLLCEPSMWARIPRLTRLCRFSSWPIRHTRWKLKRRRFCLKTSRIDVDRRRASVDFELDPHTDLDTVRVESSDAVRSFDRLRANGASKGSRRTARDATLLLGIETEGAPVQQRLSVARRSARRSLVCWCSPRPQDYFTTGLEKRVCLSTLVPAVEMS